MDLPKFKLEDFFSKWEFKAPYLLCNSDTETFSMKEIIELADDECKEMWNTLSLGYTETRGHPLLKEEISHLYPSLSEANVLCFAGAEEGIYCSMRSLLNTGDHVIVITPCYQSLFSLPATITGNVTAVELSPKNAWQLEIDKLKSAIQQNTKMIVINFPHNPTGTTIPKESLEAIISVAREHDLYIFSDEVYRYLEIDPKDQLPPVSEVYEKGISLSVMSKAFGLGGLRIGWITCKDTETLDAIAEYKHYTSICNNAPSEILTLIALRSKDHLINRNREIMTHNLNLLDTFFEEYSHKFSWVRPKGGCIGFVKVEDESNMDKFIERLIDQQGVLLLPGSVYNYTPNYFRIGFGRKNFTESLNRLKLFLQ